MRRGVLNANNLTRRFGDRIAVDNATLTVEPGQVFALLGPNGAGKTTTLRMLAGLIRPSSGQVAIDGEAMLRQSAARLRRRIGLLTEAPGLWDRLTVRQNLTVYAKLYGVGDVEGAVRDTMRLFSIEDRAGQPAAQLSKGLKQRVALARALVHKPDIVLLDEPTSGLDPESARDVRELIFSLRSEGRSVLLSTHNLDEVERIADRVGVLRTSMVALDTPAALRSQLFGSRLKIRFAGPAAPFVPLLDGAGISDVRSDDNTLMAAVDSLSLRTPHILRRLITAGAEVLSVVPDEPSLEEVYLRLLRDNLTVDRSVAAGSATRS